METTDIKTLIPRGAALLAPMAGVADLAFRSICKAHGCAFTFTEMVSAKGLYYSGDGSKALLELAPNERPAGVQLFGSEPAIMARMAAWVCETMREGISLIDINMGCPAPKITRNGEGSALMRDIPLAGRIVCEVVNAAACPVSVKFRAGWDDKSINAVDFAKAMEDGGASLVTVHGRTRVQFYSGRADMGIIARVVDAVSIPVVGNGDVSSAEDYLAVLNTTGCHAVMVGRGAQGNPWVFEQIAAIRDGREAVLPDLGTRLNVALAHARLAIEHKGERLAMREMRKHMGWYLKGAPKAAGLRAEINRVCTYGELLELLKRSFEGILI